MILPTIVLAQSGERKKLESERKNLVKEINYIQKLLNENKGSKSNTVSELKTIERKIYKRERLIKTIVKEIKLLDKHEIRHLGKLRWTTRQNSSR